MKYNTNNDNNNMEVIITISIYKTGCTQNATKGGDRMQVSAAGPDVNVAQHRFYSNCNLTAKGNGKLYYVLHAQRNIEIYCEQ